MERFPVAIPRQAGIHVRRIREGAGMTRAQLAKAAGVSERLVASLELGEAPGIQLDKLMAVLQALDMQLELHWAPRVAEPDDQTPGITESPMSEPTQAKLQQIQEEAPTEGSSYHDAMRQFVHDNYGVAGRGFEAATSAEE